MGLAVDHAPPDNHSISLGPLTESGNSDKCSVLSHGSNEDEKCQVCRVCHCIESDRRGDTALDFLNITPPFPEGSETDGIHNMKDSFFPKFKTKDMIEKESSRGPGFVEFVSPDGEIFVCKADIETGSYYQQDALVELGCSCKGDISLAHYACALKWFISHGSTTCEICGNAAKNIRLEDFKKVIASLKDYESLRERTAAGQLAHVNVLENSDVDPDAVAAIRRQRLSEISSWFNPHNTPTAISQPNTDQSLVNLQENIAPMQSPATKWAVEGTGILVATGLLTVILAWLIAPRVGKKTAKNGLHILLGGVCALTVVIFLRFFVLSRIKYGPARYWAILFVFWFLVFGIWASRTHGAHTT